jgi:hypothetical protein
MLVKTVFFVAGLILGILFEELLVIIKNFFDERKLR